MDLGDDGIELVEVTTTRGIDAEDCEIEIGSAASKNREDVAAEDHGDDAAEYCGVDTTEDRGDDAAADRGDDAAEDHGDGAAEKDDVEVSQDNVDHATAHIVGDDTAAQSNTAEPSTAVPTVRFPETQPGASYGVDEGQLPTPPTESPQLPEDAVSDRFDSARLAIDQALGWRRLSGDQDSSKRKQKPARSRESAPFGGRKSVAPVGKERISSLIGIFDAGIEPPQPPLPPDNDANDSAEGSG